MDDGSQGIDDQFIKNAMARLTWQVSPRNKISAYFDEIDKYRGHDMQSNYDPETAAHGVELAGVSHHRDQVDVAGDQLAVPRGRLLEQHRVLHQRIPRGHREAGVHRGVVSPTPRKNELDLGGYTQAGPINTTESPKALLLERRGDLRQRAPTPSSSAPTSGWGTFKHTRLRQRRPDPAVPRQRRRQRRARLRERSGVRAVQALDRAGHRADPQLAAGLRRERSNRDLGIYIQDSWRLNRLTANVGLRWETLNAKVLAGKSPAGRFVPERTFDGDRGRAGLERLRAAHGPGLRPVRQRQDRDQVLAEPLQPVAHHRHRRQLQPAAVADRDAAVGRQERQRHRRGLAALRLHRARTARSTSPACRRTSASPRSTNTASTRAPGTSSRASRSRTSCSAACRSAARGGRAISTT